jgi:G:T-mismatch repair DNA endonuclease (very short patch repair protein)
MGNARAANPVEVERVRRMQRTHLASREPTKCEQVLYLLMDEVFGEGEWASQYLVFDKWTVDACVPGLHLVVQAAGNYWHGFDPATHDHPTVRANMDNDRRQLAYLTKAGWRVERIWEHDLLREPESCRARLAGIRAATVSVGGP